MHSSISTSWNLLAHEQLKLRNSLATRNGNPRTLTAVNILLGILFCTHVYIYIFDLTVFVGDMEP